MTQRRPPRLQAANRTSGGRRRLPGTGNADPGTGAATISVAVEGREGSNGGRRKGDGGVHRRRLGFPTVLWGGALVVVAGFWALVLVGAADAHGPGHHGAGGAHPAAGAHHGAAAGQAGSGAAPHAGAPGTHYATHHGSHQAAHHGSGRRTGGTGVLAAAGLDGVPVTVVLLAARRPSPGS